ncbi:MAG: hypothetical protein HC780_15475 [Leptolyngbyaceae cyanobacterium CSU_1_3]|nr:hypothetical protein [Leptolyngbyaceae cyanobacterium CSU_1_3]
MVTICRNHKALWYQSSKDNFLRLHLCLDSSDRLGFPRFFHILNWDFLTFADRPKGLFKDPNVFGPFLIPVVLYAALEFESSKGKSKLAKLGWATLFLLASIGSALSFSRAAWLNYGISISSYIVLRVLTASSMRVAIRRSSTYISLLLLLLTVFGALLIAQPNTAEFFYSEVSLSSLR